MMTRTYKLLTLAALVLTASVAAAQSSNSPYQCPNGQCSLDSNSGSGYQPYGNSYPSANQLSQDRYNYPTQQYDQRSYSPSDYNMRINDVYPTSRNSQLDYPQFRDELRSRFEEGFSPLSRGVDDYQSRLNGAVDSSFRTPIVNDYRYRGGELDRGYNSGYGSSNAGYSSNVGYGSNAGYDSMNYSYRGRLDDPFRLPNYDRSRNDLQYQNAPLSRDNRSGADFDSRYRVPAGPVDYSNPRENFDPRFDSRPLSQDRRPAGYSPTGYSSSNDYRTPVARPEERLPRGIDPLTPPLPRRDDGNETEAIYKELSARYGNPVNVRSVQAMNSTQALQLYREVSTQTDQRHLEPSSYDLRIRRGIRNIGLALENPAFTRAMGISADSFRVDGFRTTLSRIAEQMRVTDYNSAQNVVQTVMQEAQNVPGLSPTVVAFEFANATIDTLDKFSALEPKEPGRGASLDLLQAEKKQTAGLETEIVGVGVEVKIHDDGLLIMKTLRGGPAAEAGLQSGDVITAIDRRSIVGMPMANSVDLMKGTSGSTMTLQIVRNGSRPSEVRLVRRRVQLYTVNDAKLLPNTNKVAYMSLSQFGPKSTEELDQALTQLHKSGMESLVLDLRGNPGGLLNVCVDITNRFLPCGTIVSTKGRLSADNMLETATFERTWSTPIVVLIDGDSASASEIFAAAIQDNQRGIVVGEKSYGKGTVQTHFPLSSISGNLRLTTARFYSPNGKAMSGAGVTPDVRVTDADGPANGDLVLEEALKIAQSQRLRDIAQAAKQCRPSATRPVQRNSFNDDLFDMVSPKTVMR